MVSSSLHGFRSQRSCETQLVQFYHDMVSNLDGALNPDQKQADVIIMDLAKAFDKVPHGRLLYKLDYYGISQVEKVQRTAARWTCRRWRNTSSVGDMLDKLEWPSLEARREQSSLTFFYKIHSGTVFLDKDKYQTPAPNLRRTRASHESQYTRYLAYSEALKNSFFPRTIPVQSPFLGGLI